MYNDTHIANNTETIHVSFNQYTNNKTINLLTSKTKGLDGCDYQTGDENALSQHLDLAKHKTNI